MSGVLSKVNGRSGNKVQGSSCPEDILWLSMAALTQLGHAMIPGELASLQC